MPSMCSNQRAWNFINVNLSKYGMVVCLSVCSFLCDVFWKKKKNLFMVNGTWPLSHFHNLLITLYCSLCKSSKYKGRRNWGVKGFGSLAGQKEVHLTFDFRRIWSYLPLQIFRPSNCPDCAKVSNLANYCTRACLPSFLYKRHFCQYFQHSTTGPELV